MPSRTEKRLADLEAEVARLKTKVDRINGAAADESEPWWEQIAGTFENDPVYEKAMRLGREYRESQRPKKPKPRKKR